MMIVVLVNIGVIKKIKKRMKNYNSRQKIIIIRRNRIKILNKFKNNSLKNKKKIQKKKNYN
jgi:hypothetical protein